MKKRYVETLKLMREELAKTKEESVQKFESEWKKRKTDLAAEFQKRFQMIRDHCEMNHPGCRCVALMTFH
jgi:hypothetical protein